MHGCFIYGNTYEDVYRYERHLVFPRLFASNAQDYVADHTMFNADERKAGSLRRYCCERLSDTVNAYTLEVSMAGHYLRDGKTIALYNEDGCKCSILSLCWAIALKIVSFVDHRVGRNLTRTLLQYYRFINVLPVPLVSEMRVQGKRRGRTRTHHSRSRARYEVKPRPKTTRCHAPIAYTNLSICYDSAGGGGVSSDEGGYSPVRPLPIAPGSSTFSGYRNYRRAATASCAAHDQYSVVHGDHGGASRSKRSAAAPPLIELPPGVSVPPKPYLSIIDLNQLTRGSLTLKASSFDADDRR